MFECHHHHDLNLENDHFNHGDLCWNGEPSNIGNDPFYPYMKHTQEVEDIIDALVHADAGNYTIDVDDDLSQSDLDYIKFEVMRRRQEEDNGNN